MKLTMTLCVTAIVSASAWAQVNPATTINNVRNQLGSAANAIAERRDATMQQAPPPSQVAPASQSAPARPANPQSEIRIGKRAVQSAAASSEEQKAGGMRMRGKRDPFVSVIRTQSADGPACSTGKKCLVVGDISLKGIVRSKDGMIAVVENGQRKTYFLHEDDPVFNGHVVKIEPDAIVFRERVVDKLGRQSDRDIVKRISKPSIS